jgi:putative membrane protein
VNFHAKALQKLKALVAGHRFIHLPDSLGGADQGLLKELQELEGADFDEGYLTFIEDTHRMQLQRYEEAMGKAQDQPTRDWLLMMEDHLRAQLNQAVAADSTAILVE